MKTIKTSELTGAALDWAVAKCEGCSEYLLHNFIDGIWSCANYKRYSTDWAQGGPIIEREIFKLFRNVGGSFTAQIKVRIPYYSPTYDADIGTTETISRSGPTPLIAAMRCYVASKLGDKIEIPEELAE